ncbi:hypothetical protein PV05_02368 [Exophiala xenobiotica]|uniref:Uncharacterized protein n=1 Tax=Exophiala xenobiotica TaxID=348802 RepID=A0A0D2ESU5_9EURO|nr:uncharacterized protein PV05_02368 [Exophiala xenobiotica]KIW57810.1 hypothetical protein PV05_02368 [Exophiala xenobiotica]
MSDAPLTPSLSATRYEHQEKIIYSVDCYIKHLFDGKGGGRNSDATDFVKCEVRDNTTDAWQQLSDQCFEASVLIKSRSFAKARTTLDRFFDKLDLEARNPNPLFMVKLWRICLQLRSNDSRVHQLKALGRFYATLGKAFSETYGEKDPLRTLITSLKQLSQADLKDTLRIGYFKTIKTLSAMVGEEKAVVLNMWSHYFKYFDRQYLDRRTLIFKFQHVWDQESVDKGTWITIIYYYTYAAYYVCEMQVLAYSMAAWLVEETQTLLCLTESPRWTLPTQAFVFASQVKASLRQQHYLDTHCPESKTILTKTMETAIARLRLGDSECQTRQSMLSDLLLKWMKEQEAQQPDKDRQPVNAEKQGEEVVSRKRQKIRKRKASLNKQGDLTGICTKCIVMCTLCPNRMDCKHCSNATRDLECCRRPEVDEIVQQGTEFAAYLPESPSRD